MILLALVLVAWVSVTLEGWTLERRPVAGPPRLPGWALAAAIERRNAASAAAPPPAPRVWVVPAARPTPSRPRRLPVPPPARLYGPLRWQRPTYSTTGQMEAVGA